MEIAAIERELRDLWQHMAADKEEGGNAITRACVFNLIVYAPGRHAEATVNRVMTDVTEENPGRIFVLLPGTEDSSSGLNAWVTAQCHLASGGRKQVCCEQIMIRGSGESIRHLPSVVTPLLIPDIPVFVWWRADIAQSKALLDALLESADRLILDSSFMEKHSIEDSLDAIRQLYDLMQQCGDRVAVSDMRWGELTALRNAVARFYDDPRCRSFLTQITGVEIECSPVALVPVLLFVGWLGSRLKWKWVGEPVDFGSVRFRSGQKEIKVSVTTCSPGAEKSLKVRLATDGKTPAEFVIRADRPAGHLISEMNAPGECHTHEVIRLDPEESESFFLEDELSILHHDRVYEESLEFLLQSELPKKRKAGR